MGRFLLALLLAVPLFAQLPPGVTRIPNPSNHFDAYYLASTPDDALWTRSAISRAVTRIDLEGRAADVTVPAPQYYYDLAVGPDGAVWMASPGVLTRVDPVDRTWRQVSVGANRDVTHVLAGPDGNLWAISPYAISRIRTDGNTVSSYPAGVTHLSGAAFGNDGALYYSTTGPDRLIRMTAAGERTTFPMTKPQSLFAGTGFFWSVNRQQNAPGDKAPAADIVKLSYTGEALAAYPLPMTAVASDALGNLWLRSTTDEGDILAELSPAGVLTKFGPIPVAARQQCHPRWFGGMTFLTDGRIAMADHFPDFARAGIDPCFGNRRPPELVNTITIVDPRIAPVISVEALGRTSRRRSSRP
jgi:sugar lactone lactonase YvrE